MSTTHTQALNKPSSGDPSDHEGIAQALQHYIDGAKSGRGDDMKLGFHPQATIFGYVGDDLLAGSIQQLYDWNDANGPATDLRRLFLAGRRFLHPGAGPVLGSPRRQRTQFRSFEPRIRDRRAVQDGFRQA